MVVSAGSKRLTIGFYPALSLMEANPYWRILADSLEQAGVRIYSEPVVFTGKWLIDHRKQVNILHLHYIQSLYCNRGKTRARLVYVVFLAIKLILARLLGYRTVFSLHNLTPTEPLIPRWIDYLGHWVAVNLSERVIVHCAEARRLLAWRYGRRIQVYLVDHPHFIDQYPNSISKAEARSALQIPDKAILFTFFGGIRPNKGIEQLIQAFINLEGENVRLVIAGNPAGDNKYPGDLQSMAKGDHRISFYMDLIKDEEIQIFLNAADIVVFPFKWILTSSSAVLAMSFARPIIVPRMGCLPELVEPDFGWLFEPNSVDSLTKTLQIAAQSNFDIMGKNAFEKIFAYTPERIAGQTVIAYGV